MSKKTLDKFCNLCIIRNNEVVKLANKPPKKINQDGTITVRIGESLKEVKRIAELENRSMSRQVAVIIKDWLANHKPAAPRGAA